MQQTLKALQTSVPILRTKLHRPAVSADLLCRSRLHELMDQGLEVTLTLVSAPAGYGKSMLVSHWVESLEQPCAWLSLDDADGDITVFLTYLIAAVRTVINNACPETQALLSAPKRPPVAVLAHSLINELDAIGTPFVLVLDDYHRIVPSSDVHDLLRFILKHPPRSLRTVIMTRHDPPLPLASLRGRGSVTDVRLRDLQFTTPEIAEFLDKTSALKVSEEALSNLEQQTEGWVAGLRLVSLGLRHLEDADTFLSTLRGGVQHTRQYLLQEVIAHLTPQMQEWLVKTSILDRFCPELCDSVCSAGDATGTSDLDGRQYVDELQRLNLFSVALDTQGKWFRHHHLLQELLNEQLKRRQGPEEIARLHSRASGWFESEGLIDEALKHALATGDIGQAAQIIERNARPELNENRWYIVKKWLSQLPDQVVQERPELLLARAFIHFYHFEIDAIPALMDRIDDLIGGDAEKHELSGEVALFRGFFWLFHNDGARSLKYLEHALDRIAVTDVRFRGINEILFGIAGQMEGQRERVTRMLTEWLNTPSPLHPLRETNLLVTLMIVFFINADPEEAERYRTRARQIAREHGLAEAAAWCDYMGSLFHLQCGALDAAIRLLEVAVERKYVLQARASVDALGALTLAYQARGQSQQAAATLQSLGEFVSYLGPSYTIFATAYKVRLELMQGRTESALRWLEKGNPPAVEVMINWLEIPCVTWCRALIAEGSATSLQAAEKQLREYAEMNKAHHNTCQTIEILVLLSLSLEQQDRAEEALSVLAEALALAEPGKFIRPFVEPGSPLSGLLGCLLIQEPDSPFIREVLAAFVAGEATPATLSPHLPEQLTVREDEILQLLAQRRRDKEIATELVISTETVKTHLKNIYQKLGVHDRSEAVRKARELHLITPA